VFAFLRSIRLVLSFIPKCGSMLGIRVAVQRYGAKLSLGHGILKARFYTDGHATNVPDRLGNPVAFPLRYLPS
jgi:hypothetical protein